jgi:hypothetical protein
MGAWPASEDPRRWVDVMKRPTIVRYRADLPPENAYPRQIISPPAGGACCLLHSRQTGTVRREGRWRYIYLRCQVCGYTVRRFVGMAPSAPTPRRTGQPPKQRRPSRARFLRFGLATGRPGGLRWKH